MENIKFTCIYCDEQLPTSQLIENSIPADMLDTYKSNIHEANVCNLCWLSNECADQRDAEGYVWDNALLDLHSTIDMERNYGK